MSDAAVDAFLGRGGDRATRDFLRATKELENAEDVVGSAPEDNGSSWFGSLAQDVEEIVGRGMDAVGAVAPYLFGPRSRYLPQMSEAAGQFLGNAAEDVSEWGSDFWEDVKGLAQGIGDELTATSWQDLQDADNANADNAWQVYDDVARPAGMIAVTPGLPAQVRAAAGLVYAPKFVSDAVNLYEGAPGGGDENGGEDGSEGGSGAVVDGMVVQPLEQLLTDVRNPGQLAEDIFEHPANLWDRVLMPATMVEGGVRGAKRVKEAAQGRYDSAMDALSDMEDNAEAFAPDDTVADVDVTPGESSPIPFVDTGHGVLDEYMADAANQYGVDLNILHKMAQQESEHGRADSNVMQVLDSTGRELGFDDVSDPKQSIYAGAAYLRKMLDAEDGDYAAAIRDYNGGGDPEYLEHVLSQPDYDVSGTRPGGAEGGYDVPAEAAYTLEPGVNHEGFSDLTEQKLRVLDAYYAELTGGDHLDVTSMRDGTHSDPGHANGTAFDVANDALHDDALRAKVIAKAEELGLRAYDEFDRSNWTENTTGDNLHLSDTGSALNARSGGIGRNAWEEYGRQVDEASEEAYASEAAETGKPLTDIEGRELGAEDVPAGLADDVRELVDHSDLPRSEDVNAPAKVDWGEERAGELASLDRMISAAEDERQRLIDDEVRRMEETPGGRGTDVGYTYDAEGNVVGRFSTSRNPQWYQDAYHRLGRAPRRSDLAQLAAENLSKEQEFAQLERQIQQMQEVRRRLAEHPEADGRSVVSAVTSEDGLVYGERSGKGGMQVVRNTSKPMSERAIAGNIKRGNEAVEYLIREHEEGRDTVVHGAMHRADIGYIDFLWGTPGKGAKFKRGYGIAHILAKHGAESGKGVLPKIVETIAKGTEIEEQHYPNSKSEYRIKIHYNGHTAVLSSKSAEKNAWLLTGWEDGIKKEVSSRAPGEGYGSAGATASAPMRTRRAGGENTSSIFRISQSRIDVNENPLVQGESNAPGKLNQTNMQVNRYQVKPMSDRAIERNIQRGNQAVEYILREHANGNDATVHGAMHRADIGYVDFLWGAPGKGAKFKKGYGLAHILAKHGAESGEGILAKIVETIAKGTDIEEQKALHGQGEKRIRIHYDGYTAVLSSARGKDSWLLTGWEDYDRIKQKEAGTHVRDEGNDSTAPTASAPTLTRRGRGGAPASTSTVSQSRTNVNENPLVQGESNAPVKLNPGEHPAPVPDREGRLPTATLGPKKPKGHFKGDRVTREEIFERARELFGAIRTGRTGRGLNGQYDRGADVARSAQYGQFDTLWHEIGHKVDSLLGLTQKAGRRFDREFLKVLNRKYEDGFLNHYRADELQPEGIAEFMKEYMRDPAQAERNFPDFYDFWKEEVGKNKDLAARVQEMREMMEVYQKQPEGAKILGDIHTDKPATLREKVSQALHDFMPTLVDDKWGIKRAEEYIEDIIGRKLTPEESAYAYARIAKDRGASAAQQLLSSTDAKATTKALNKLYGGVLKKEVTFPLVLEKIQQLEKTGRAYLEKNGFKDYQEALKTYLVARRFMEVHDLKTRDGKAYQMPRNYEEYRSFVDAAPQLLKDAAQDIYDLNRNVLAIMHHEGMLSDKLYQTLTREHGHYVSLARTFEDDANGMMGFGASDSFVNVGNNIKRLTEEGSVRDVVDPLQTIPKQLTQSLLAVERNKVAQKFVKNTDFYGVGGIVEKVAGGARARDSSFKVWLNGKQEVYNTTPEIYQALKSLKPEGADSLIKFLGYLPARLMRAGAVIYNPAFLVKNLLRDQLTAYLYSEYGYIPFVDMARGVFHLLKQDDLFHEYANSGAMMSSIVKDGKTIVPELAKAYAKHGMRQKIFRAINPYVSLPALSEFIEQSTRLGLYAKARGKGAGILEATREAREGTLDFGRAGTLGRSVNRYVPFFNAVIQDPVLFIEKTRKNPARMMKRCAPLVLGSLALYALIRSRQEWSDAYDEMMPYEKNMFWNIPVPRWVSKTGWVRYPKPFGPGFLFASLPERIADYASGHDKSGKGVKRWAKGFLEQFNPASLPPLMQAVAEWNANYSFFKDRSIVPQKESKLPNAQQYGLTTSEFAKRIGKALDLSPRKIDNLGQNLFAGAYSSINSVIDQAQGKRRTTNPFSTLTVDPYRSPQSTQDFYDRLDEATKAYNGAKNGGKPAAKQKFNYQMLTHANKRMSDLNKKEQAARAKGDDARVDAINRQQLKVARDALRAYKE